jgi:PAS domain S-box-containing protein
MRSRWPAHFVLFIAVGVSLAATVLVNSLSQEREKAKFSQSVAQAQQTIEIGVNKYITLLDSVRALAVARVSMNATQFQAYVNALDLRRNYPGIAGLGLALKFPSAQKNELVEKVRQQGMPEFQIWPNSDQTETCPLVIVEPRDGRNLSTIGYDLFAEHESRTAAISAAENGKPIASRTILVNQKGLEPEKKGFFVLVPVYVGGGLPENIAQRRTNVAGFVHCAFQSHDLLEAIVPKTLSSPIGFRIYDGARLSGASPICQSSNWPSSTSFFQSRETNSITVASRPWTLVFASQSNFATGVAPLGTLFGGLVLSSLLWRIARSQSVARETAEKHALELKKSENALRESETRRLRAETLSSMMVAHIGLNGVFLKAPGALSVLLGYPPTELERKSFDTVTHPDDREADARAREAILEGKQSSANIEKRLVSHDGSILWVASHYSLVADSEGNPLYLLTYIQDVSQRKRDEAEILELNTRLEHRVAERTAALQLAIEDLEACSYSVSHDLRAPLRHIDGYVNLLTGNPRIAGDDTARRHAMIVSKAAQQMSQLVDALLNFSKLGRIRLSVKPDVAVNEIVREVCQMLGAETENRQISWTIADLPKVTGDPTLLRQVFANLVSNAVKYSQPRSPATIQIGTEDRDQEILFFVRDNGVGFDMEYAHKLFGVFQRLHSEEQFQGNGIGLANIRKIVSRHGGRTWAEGAPDQGATFYFTLPKRPSI